MEIELTRKKFHRKKIILTTLIVLSFFCLGCYRSIPGPTLTNLEIILNVKLKKVAVIFSLRSLGYVVGCCIAMMFDLVRRSTYRQMLIISLKSLTAVTAFGVPLSSSLSSLAVNFYVAGICLSTLDISYSIYLLDIWKQASNPYFQCLYFFYSLGGLFGPGLVRSFLHVSNETNSSNTTSIWMYTNVEYFPVLTYAYLVLIFFILFFIILWVCVCIFVTIEITPRRFRTVTQRPSKEFYDFAVITTGILIFITGSIDLGYQNMLATFGYSVYKLSTVVASELTVIFWVFYTLGSFCAIFVARKFHTFCMILFQLMLIVVGGMILLFFAENDYTYLVIGNSVVAFGSSSLFPTTIIWLETYIQVTHKILAILFLGMALAEMVIPEILGRLLVYGHWGISSFVLSIPVIYFLVFAVQVAWFFPHGERRVLLQQPITKSNRRLFPVFLSPSRQFTIPTIHSSTQTDLSAESKKVQAELIIPKRGSRKNLRPLGDEVKSEMPLSQLVGEYESKGYETSVPKISSDVNVKPDEETEDPSELNESSGEQNGSKQSPPQKEKRSLTEVFMNCFKKK